jgi:hypothetical protein
MCNTVTSQWVLLQLAHGVAHGVPAVLQLIEACSTAQAVFLQTGYVAASACHLLHL